MAVDAKTRQRIGNWLDEHPSVYRYGAVGIRVASRARRRRQIRAYLDTNSERYLRIGASWHWDPGWLSVDLLPLDLRVVFMDATKPLRFPPHTFEAILCEHMIEHISYNEGLFLLRECHRVLKPGGVVRILTPDLALVRRLLDDSPDTTGLDAYVEWSNEMYGTADERADPTNRTFTANRLVRAWGHTFIYDEHTLRSALMQAGFSDVVLVQPGESRHAYLKGMDRHHEQMGREFNALETLGLEATA